MGIPKVIVESQARPVCNTLRLTSDSIDWSKWTIAVSQPSLAASVDSPSLLKWYRILDHGLVMTFLREHGDLKDVLAQVPEQVRSFVPEVTGFQLSLAKDEEEGLEYLVVQVETGMAPEDAIEGLDRFDFKWWLKQPMASSGLIVILPAFT
ncbi:MAG: hypothetical protein HYY13_01640 [Nitrospirae bacterium]|nr:hypothetical protein [Nitrospirota bacterium]